MPIDYQAVTNAAAALQQKKEKVTVQRVREHLGKGSPNTIAKYLRQWRKDQESPAVPDEVQGLFVQLWNHACTNSSNAFKMEREALEAQFRNFDEGHRKDQKYILELHAELRAAKAECQQLTNRLDRLSGLLSSQNEQNLHLARKLEEKDRQHRVETGALSERLMQVQDELQESQQALLRLQKEARDQEKVLNQRIDQERTQREKSEKAHVLERQKITANAATLQEKLTQALTNMKSLERSMEKAEMDAANWQKTTESTRQALVASEKDQASLKAENASLAKALKDAKRREEDLIREFGKTDNDGQALKSSTAHGQKSPRKRANRRSTHLPSPDGDGGE